MKKAFSVGELLVTMAIIGIVAVLVIPGFIRDYERRVHITKLKRVVEIIEGAVNQACIENNVTFFFQTPYAKVNSKDSQQRFIDDYLKVANKEKAGLFSKYYATIGGVEKPFTLGNNVAVAKLIGGEAITMGCFSADNCVFQIDTNSVAGPNVGGRDAFTIVLDTKTNDLKDIQPMARCGTDVLGAGCFARIMSDNWEMRY